MRPTPSSLFVEVECLQSSLEGGGQGGMSLSEYELISTLWTEPVILKQQKKKSEAFIRVPLSNLPLSSLINLLWSGVLQSLQEYSPYSTFPGKKKNKLAFISNIFSFLPSLSSLYSKNL